MDGCPRPLGITHTRVPLAHLRFCSTQVHWVEECFNFFRETFKMQTERFNHNLDDIFGWCLWVSSRMRDGLVI